MATQSELEMSNREHQLRLLRGAICEYLDENKIEELIKDLILISGEEEADFYKKAETYGTLKLLLSQLSMSCEEIPSV